MINYLIIKTVGKKLKAMFAGYHRVERAKFVFTRRTKVRLGGFDMNI